MARHHTYPIIYDDLFKLSTKRLKELGLLSADLIKNSSLLLTVGGTPYLRISIKVNTTEKNPYIRLEYRIETRKYNYSIGLTYISSNLGKGKIWAFICPQTGLQTRVLYFNDEMFVHRKTFKHAMYRSQTYSKRTRKLIQMYDGAVAWEKSLQKYFRPYYKGKPTRTLKRMIKKQEQSKGYTVEELLVMDL